MALPRYGVAKGTLIRFYRDPPDNFGNWYHGHVEIATPAGMWTSALDVDTPNGVGVSYRLSKNLVPSVLGPVQGLPDGFHLVTSSSTSGAIDYIRSGLLKDRLWSMRLFRELGLPPHPQPLPVPFDRVPQGPRAAPPLPAHLHELYLQTLSRVIPFLPPSFGIQVRPWLQSNGDNALKSLEAELIGNRRVYIFGDRFQNGQGVHDVHQNQGDPIGSQWAAQNGIWQDGAVAVERPNGTLFFWQVRFNSQATNTDNNGHPI